MIKRLITVALNYSPVLYLAIIQGCATTMDASKLPHNMVFGQPDGDGHRRLVSITYTHPVPRMAESEYLDKMIECIDDSVVYESIVLTDGSVLRSRQRTESAYPGIYKDIVENSDVITGVDTDTDTVNADGVFTYPAALGTTAIARFSLAAKPGGANDYILLFHNIEVGLKELLADKGFTYASNNPHQQPHTLHQKTRQMSETINACLAAGQMSSRASVKDYESPAIVNELLAKAMKLDSYAQDYILQGVTLKRMYFQFSRDGKPFYRFRSEYVRDGKRYVHLVNVDGEHDCHYYPDEAVAYRVSTESDRSESGYIAKKAWHFDYEGAHVTGEDVVNGKECYLLRKGMHTLCVWKKHGLQLDLRMPEGVMYYDNFDLRVSDDLFILPDTVTIIDR